MTRYLLVPGSMEPEKEDIPVVDSAVTEKKNAADPVMAPVSRNVGGAGRSVALTVTSVVPFTFLTS